MKRILSSFLIVVGLTACAHAETGMRQASPYALVKSPHSVDETIDRLEAAVKGAGATVFARIDHAAGAASIGEEMRPTQILIFGNPRMGTPLMQRNELIAIDLPIRVLAREAEDGVVWLSYLKPGALKARYNIQDRDEVFDRMAGALKKLTGAAVAAE